MVVLTMPAKNALKIYGSNSFYHIYNRGVNKMDIFKDSQDYIVFLNYLKESIGPPPDPAAIRETITLKGQSFQGVPHQPKNFFGNISLLAYALMPNHFHLLVKQVSRNGIEKFMRSLATRYSAYFHKKYKTVGYLFQGRYKAVLVNDDSYLLHLSRYIHLNPSEYTAKLTEAYSSYSDYLKIRNTEWVNTDLILSFFDKAKKPFLKGVNTYQNFVENYRSQNIDLGSMILEEPE